MTYFFRLVRPLNLAIIGLTMYGIRFYLKHSNPSLREIDDSLSFFLLVISTIFIAAAGNIINDYFDVKADRINKPEKLIITKHIKKRWAIVTHWLLNGLGFLIALSFSIQFNSFSLAFIHLLSINALWFYSTYFKRKLFLGNLIVALLTAFIPLLVLLFYHILANERKVETSTLYGPQLILFLALFAFIQNLAREIIKDTQDIEGDKTIHVRSVPMKFGKMNALLLAAVFLCILPMFYLLSMIFPSVFIMGEC
jgi:4-hydroxybenzoate polyprenyltransferase